MKYNMLVRSSHHTLEIRSEICSLIHTLIAFSSSHVSLWKQKGRSLFLYYNRNVALAVTSTVWGHADGNITWKEKHQHVTGQQCWSTWNLQRTWTKTPPRRGLKKTKRRDMQTSSHADLLMTGRHVDRDHFIHLKHLAGAQCIQHGWVLNHGSQVSVVLEPSRQTDRQTERQKVAGSLGVWSLRGFSRLHLFLPDQPDRKSMTLHSHGRAQERRRQSQFASALVTSVAFLKRFYHGEERPRLYRWRGWWSIARNQAAPHVYVTECVPAVAWRTSRFIIGHKSDQGFRGLSMPICSRNPS